MKATIGFFAAFVLVVLLGFYSTPQNSNATSFPNKSGDDCCLTGYAKGYITITVYLNGVAVNSCPVNANGTFTCCYVASMTPYTVVAKSASDCYATLNNVICANGPISFRGVASVCQ